MRVVQILGMTVLAAAVAALEGSVSEILRRLSILENPPGPAMEQHEAWTSPPIMVGPLGATYWDEATLPVTDGTAVALVPIKNLTHPLRVRRMSTVIRHGTGAGDGTFAMGLFRLEWPRPTRDITTAMAINPSFRLIPGTLGAKLHVSTAAARFNVTLDREVVIDPAKGLYFVALHANSINCLWHTPSAVSPGPWTAWSAFSGGIGVGAFPDTLVAQVRGNFAPSVVLRSTMGISIFGDSNYD